MSHNLFRLLSPVIRHPRSAALLVSKASVSSSNGLLPESVLACLTTTHNAYNVQRPRQRLFHTTRQTLASRAEVEKVLDDVEDSQDESDPEYLSTKNPHWVEVGLSPEIIKLLNRNGITEFTKVQGEAMEPILSGLDVMGRSRTGTGKTLAFGLPAMTRLVDLAQEKGIRNKHGRMARGRKPSMLVLCPTRELARQVADELTIYSDALGLDVACFHGGVSYNPQTDALYGGLDILVGTPGRVLDHLKTGNLNLSECNIAVLDEADQMLNMGFADQVETVFEGLGKANAIKTQVLLFSATTPDWVKNMAKRFQKKVHSIDSTGMEGGARVAKTVRHMAVEIQRANLKEALLEDIILSELENGGEGRKGKVLIFTDTKRDADAVAMNNVFRTLTAQSIHGDHSQHVRDQTLDQFRAGKFRVLVATDVAARGLDIKDVDLVVQLNPPSNVDVYVHRSGRTGRAGAKGASIILYSRDQWKDLKFIERDLGHGFSFEVKPPPSEEAIVAIVAKNSVDTIKSMSNKSVSMFKGTADKLLAETNDPADLVARCLAAMNKRPDTDLSSHETSSGWKDDRYIRGDGRGDGLRNRQSRDNRYSGESRGYGRGQRYSPDAYNRSGGQYSTRRDSRPSSSRSDRQDSNSFSSRYNSQRP